jgi:hypothetical protein
VDPVDEPPTARTGTVTETEAKRSVRKVPVAAPAPLPPQPMLAMPAISAMSPSPSVTTDFFDLDSDAAAAFRSRRRRVDGWLLAGGFWMLAVGAALGFIFVSHDSDTRSVEPSAKLTDHPRVPAKGKLFPRSEKPHATPTVKTPEVEKPKTPVAKVAPGLTKAFGNESSATETRTPELTGPAERAIYQTVPKGRTSASPLAAAATIDALVLAKLEEKGIPPAAPCTDAVFLRRVYLDTIGTLPTAQEARAFLNDVTPNKRQVLIDQLLARREFADYWSMKWSDILRVKSEFPINLWPNATRAYHHWIRASLRDNVPYDQFVRTLLTSSGSNFRTPAVNFYRAVQGRDPQNISRAVALTFMGVRPETWPAERWSTMTPFFAPVGYKATREWKEEIVYFDGRKLPTATEAEFPDGTKVTLPAERDPRPVFADWLIRPENPWFTRNIANRTWSWLVGRGIVHEADDLRPDNPPSIPELLAFLERELIGARYDSKHLYRIILNSQTYQRSCIPASTHAEGAALFAFCPVRRLEAEVLIDAICQITGTTEKYQSPIPEPFTYLPAGQRAISLPDGSITSPFLDMFGRPPRDTGLESERNNAITAAQRLHLLNSSHIQRAIEKGPRLAALYGSGKAPKELAEELYLTILSRYPAAEELARATDHTNTRGRNHAVDVAWALINSAEFLCRH